MERICLDEGWLLAEFDCREDRSYQEIESAFLEGTGKCYEISAFPAQVHDVLLDHGVIENPNEKGYNPDLWIHEKDWAYACEFSGHPGRRSSLEFQGLDTFADVYLNGHLLEQCRDTFLYYKIDVTRWLGEKNFLVVYFHSAKRRVEEIQVPEKYQGRVPQISMARIFRTGYHDYCGPIPCLIRCGIYGPVILRETGDYEIKSLRTDTFLEENRNIGRVQAEALFAGDFQGEPWGVSLYDREGKLVGEAKGKIGSSREKLELEIQKPGLWYPGNYGRPNLYRLSLWTGREKEEQEERILGFRDIRITEDFQVMVNGAPVKLWGANLAHPDTMSNCWREERMKSLLDWCQLGNFNVIRVWGESEIYPEEFYRECDKRGILVWQDFYLCNTLYSEEADFLELCRREAAQMVERLRHHPCILLWCGGNELFLARDYNYPGERCFGEKIVKEIFPQVCRKLDPERLYYVSSPYGGEWANNPEVGDTHGYTHLWYVPGRKFPVFLSENCRVSVPPLRTLEKIMSSGELWPEDYNGKVTRRKPLKWPETWSRHNTNQGYLKLGPVEHYFDAETPRELAYRINASYSEYIHKEVGRFRRGYPGDRGKDRRITQGHMLWRLNNNSNIISYGVVDYLGEANYPYYELKRCYEPFLVSCELEDHGYVWVTNDTGKRVEGILEISLFDLEKNSFHSTIKKEFLAEPDDSMPVISLDSLGQFLKRNIVYIRALSRDRKELGSWIEYADIERNLNFPEDSGLEICQEGEFILVKSRKFARCVELTGEEAGDAFGWIFTDNYFDLFPGEVKKVRILGRHKQGVIGARGIYDENTATCRYRSNCGNRREK